MALEVAHSGVFDAVTGEHLAGTVSADLKKVAKANEEVVAYPADDSWFPVAEGTTVLPSGTRTVYYVSGSKES